MKILIIEDEMFVGWGLESALSAAGHQVCGTAESEAEAIEMAEAHQPDLVVVDIGLQGPGNGLRAVREILKRRTPLVVFSSAWNDPATNAAIEEIAPYANVPKPCTERDIVAVVNRAAGATGGRPAS